MELAYGHKHFGLIKKSFGEQEPSPTGSPCPQKAQTTARSSLERNPRWSDPQA